jgi:hypothetical protein
VTTPNFAPPEGENQSPVIPITPVVQAPLAKPKKRGGGATNLILVLGALVAVGGLAFAGGRATAPASTATEARGNFPGNGVAPNGSFTPGQGGGFGSRNLTVSGTVTAVTGSTMTIQTTSGSTVTVDTSSATYHAQASAAPSDVTTGTSVQVSVSGGGFPGGGAPGAPDASGAPAPAASGGNGTTTLTASDVTITTK